MKYIVKTTFKDEYLTAKAEFDNIVDAYKKMKAIENDKSVSSIEIVDEDDNEVLQSILEELKEAHFQNLLNDDYTYEVWLDNGYSASEIISQLQRNNISDILCQINEAWCDECWQKVQEMSIEELLR